MKKQWAFLSIFIITLITAGCATYLPSAKKSTKSPWKTFDEAKASFDKITPYKTTTEDLKKLGFDPFTTPNIKILTHLDIIQRFMPNPSIKKEDLDSGIQACIDAKDDCRAYEVEPRVIKRKRYGNLLLDIFNFKRKTRKSGWRFKALIVMEDDLVVYKLWGGNPAVVEFEEKKNPLGPFQDSERFLIDVTTKVR